MVGNRRGPGGQSGPGAEVARLVNAALKAHAEDRLDEAVVAYRKLLRLRPDMSAVYPNLATALAQLGRLDEAVKTYRIALKAQPTAATYGNLGATFLRQGATAEAEAAFRQAIQLDPGGADHHANLGAALFQRKADADAIGAYTETIALAPGHASAHYGLGCAMSRGGRSEEAVDAFRHAVALQPDWAEAHAALGRELRTQGRHDEAIAACRRAVALAPGNADILGDLGMALLDIEATAEAEPVLRQALALAPGHAIAQYGLGVLHLRERRVADALASFRSALACMPIPPRTLFAAASRLLECGQAGDAFSAFRRAVEAFPDDSALWCGLAAAVESGGVAPADLPVDLLIAVLTHPSVRPNNLRRAVLGRLWLDSGLADAAATDLAGNRLLLLALATFPLCDEALENRLTTARRAMVLAKSLPDAVLPLCVALADQGLLVDYVWAEDDAEAAAVAELTEAVSRGEIGAAKLALLAAYRPLARVAGSKTLLAAPALAAIADLLRRHVAEPLEERQLAAEIPCLTPVADTVSAKVREQYEAFPYPRWLRPGFAPERLGFTDLGRIIPARPRLPALDRPMDVLIAGCGTGQHALSAASSYRGARVLAVDLSRTSLAYAIRRTQSLGVGGIDYAQADLLELGRLDRCFDVIECQGVLHHLADPLAGWQVLANLLWPHGVMKIGLYSEAARQAVVAGRAFIAEAGYPPTLDGIRRCRQAILALPPDHPVRRVATWPDFHAASECCDLLFHVQEHRFTLPRIEQALDRLGLTFLGFADTKATGAFHASCGDDADPLSLSAWHAFETEHPATFAGMYQFWVGKRS